MRLYYLLGYPFLIGLLIVIAGYATTRASAPAVAPKPIVATAGLSRFPVLDSRQKIRTGIFIVCRAYSNRPGFDVTAPITDSTLGFRVVSDCRTVRGS